MLSIKDFLDALNKMANLRLNIAIFITCLTLIFLSPPDKFILDPFPKIIVQTLILITSIRIAFAIIGGVHDALKNKLETRAKLINDEKLKIEKEKETKNKRAKLISNFNKLDIFQLKIIKDLLITNHALYRKNATIFSLINMGFVYSVSTSNSHEGLSLTDLARDIIENDISQEIDNIEENAIELFLKKLSDSDKILFSDFSDTNHINTYYDRFGNMKLTRHHSTFSSYEETILFQQPVRKHNYVISPNAKKIIKKLNENNDI